ncbi:hypothetical protein D3C71_1632460 [compost metagenome]
MAHSVVAVHDGHGGLFVRHADVGPDIDSSGFDTPDVLRQPDDAMSVGPLQISVGHQAGDGFGIGLRNPDAG